MRNNHVLFARYHLTFVREARIISASRAVCVCVAEPSEMLKSSLSLLEENKETIYEMEKTHQSLGHIAAAAATAALIHWTLRRENI